LRIPVPTDIEVWYESCPAEQDRCVLRQLPEQGVPAKESSRMNGVATQPTPRNGRRRGSTLVEYTVILVIVSIAGILLLKTIGQSTNRLLESTNNNMPT